MKGTDALRLAGIGLIACSALAACACGRPAGPRNLLVITLDTMRADRLPAYGGTGVETPALDRLAARGAVFEQAFAAVPLTLPSHASLFTGAYPQRLGVRDNAGDPLGAHVPTLAQVFRREGFATGAIVASGVLAPGRGLAEGFQTYDMSTEGCGPTGSRRGARAVADAAVAWLAARETDPFFLWLHMYDTHQPYRLPQEYSSAYPDPYSAAIAYEDAEIARVLDYLDRRGLLDDTLVVIAGDHGESLGDHGEETHGIFVYQEALRVPLIMAGPGARKVRVAPAVRLVDVAPTVLDLFGLRPFESADGTTLVSLLRGAREAQEREVYGESLYPLRFGWGALRSLQSDRYKYIDGPKPELYDLWRDPRESHNLIASRASVAAAMRQRLRAFEDDPAATVTPAAPEVAARLASLGYASGSPAAPEAGQTLPDPKEHIDAFNTMMRVQAERIAMEFGTGPCGHDSGR